MYKFYKEDGTWSRLVNLEYIRVYFRQNVVGYGSNFEDWFADMMRQDLIRHCV